MVTFTVDGRYEQNGETFTSLSSRAMLSALAHSRGTSRFQDNIGWMITRSISPWPPAIEIQISLIFDDEWGGGEGGGVMEEKKIRSISRPRIRRGCYEY